MALLFNGITGAGIGFFFGNAGIGWWSGQWWWIPLTALGGLIVSFLRKLWKVPEDVPSPIQLAHNAWVDPATVIPWVTISAISLIVGASLGPFFGLAVMGGGFGSWLVTRLEKENEEEARQEYTLTGMAGTMGAAFTSPLFAAILASELSPTEKRNYVTAFIPALFAATIGYVIYFGVTGETMLDRYELPIYDFRFAHVLIGILLGVLAAFILILFALIKKLVTTIFSRIPNPLVSGAVGGALVGLIAFALPLTATSGSSQLTTATRNFRHTGDRLSGCCPDCQDVCHRTQPVQRIPGRRRLSDYLHRRYSRGSGQQSLPQRSHRPERRRFAGRCAGRFLGGARFPHPDSGRHDWTGGSGIGAHLRCRRYFLFDIGAGAQLHRAAAKFPNAGKLVTTDRRSSPQGQHKQ